jgi:hypothetical protein
MLDRISVTNNIFILKNGNQSSKPNFGRFWGFKKFKKGLKSACEGRISQQILLILLRSRKILSFEASFSKDCVSASPDNDESACEGIRVLVKAIRVLMKAIRVPVKALRVLAKAIRVHVKALRVPVKALRVLAKAIRVLVKALRVPVKAVRVLVTAIRALVKAVRMLMKAISSDRISVVYEYTTEK